MASLEQQIHEKLNHAIRLLVEVGSVIGERLGTKPGRPCDMLRVIDGDTVDVRLKGGVVVWRVRISGVDCPEPGTVEGDKATAFTRDVLEQTDGLTVQAMMPESSNLLSGVKFGRVSGDFWVTPDKTLGEMLLHAGLAARDERYPLVNPPPEGE